jgi:hypothetical protein
VFTPEDCIRDHCSDQAQACGKDHGCLAALQKCEEKCQKDQTCWTNCIAQKDNTAASALWKCIIDNNCLDNVETAIAIPTPHECLENKCPDTWKACLNDDKCIPTIHDCEKKCKEKTSCWELCLDDHKNKAANDVIKCGLDNDCFKNHHEQKEKHMKKVMHKMETALALFEPRECIE